MATKYIDNEQLSIDSNKMFLTKKGIFISDTIMSDLIV